MERFAEAGFYPAVDGVHVRGRFKPVFPDEGEPIPWLVIHNIASKSGDTISRPARPEDQERFPDAWKAYQGEDVQQKVRTPLSVLPGFDDEKVRFYRFHSVMDVEQLSELSDGAIQALGVGALDSRKIALMHLKTHAHEAEAKREESVSQLQEQVAQQSAQIEKLMGLLEDKVEEKPRCAKDGCNAWVKKGEQFCRHHG